MCGTVTNPKGSRRWSCTPSVGSAVACIELPSERTGHQIDISDEARSKIEPDG
jgi:hypothetical protein